GPRGRSVNCGSVPSAQCVRLGSEINRLDLPEPRQIQPGAVLEGWLAYELIDETTPVECEAGGQTTSSGDENPFYGLTNPQTIDLSTL
ncbi:hypothetical protein, partial [Collinsella aerofaciens]